MRNIRITAAQTAVLMAILTLGSKFLGFLREMVIAGFYGAGDVVDAYVMANNIPVMIFGAAFSAVATAYMPIFSKKHELEGEEEANLFTSRTLNIMLAVAFTSSVLGFFFSDAIIWIFAPGFAPEKADLTVFYLKITFSFIIFNSVATLLEAFLQYKNVFLPQIIIGYVQSMVIIAVTVISAFTTHYYLAFGILIGCAVRSAGVVLLAKKKGFSYSFDWKLGAATKEILILALPVFIGGSINQINAFIDKMLASGLVTGSISALNYGNMLVTMITTMTASILVTIIYPKMAKANSLEDYDSLSRMAEKGISLIFIIAVPCTLGAMLYSEQVIQVVYERGAFDPVATALTGPAFFYYSLGITFLCLNLLYTKIYYSLGNTKTPVYCAAVGVTVNVVLNLILIRYMAHAGLALATSIAAAINAMLLYYSLKRAYPHFTLVKSTKKLWLIFGISLASVGASYGVYRLLSQVSSLPRLILLFCAVAVAGLSYLLLLYLCKIEEVAMVLDLFYRKKRQEKNVSNN